MNKEQQMVKEFHERFGAQSLNSPITFEELGDREQKLRNLRIDLIEEELGELREALENQDIVEIADALGDLLYVVYGAGVTYGIDLEPIFEEIHRSNMSKGDPEIKIREDGKILKAKNYFRPNLKPIIDKMKEVENE